MTPIDPARRSFQGAFVGGPDAPTFDAAAVLMALSAQQMGIMQTTLINQITGGRGELAKIAELGSSAHKLTLAADEAQRRELDEVNFMLTQVDALRDQYSGGETSSLTINEADNNRFNQLSEWMAERYLPCKPMVELQEPTAEEIQATLDQGLEPPAPQLMAIPEAIEQNVRMLQGYLRDVQSGEANNLAMRSGISRALGLDVYERQALFGANAPPSSVNDLREVAVKLEQRADETIAKLAEKAAQIGQLGSQVTEKGLELSGFLQAFTQDLQQQADREFLEWQLEQMQVQERFRQALAEIEEQLNQAALAASSHFLPAAVVDQLLDKLSTVDRQQLDNDLASWRLDFAQAWDSAPAPPKTVQATAAAMRRDYL